MTLSEKIQKDLTDAMRSKDELRLSVLRGIKSAIQYKETEKIRALDENESIQLLQTLVKQRKESIDQFTKGNRPDLSDIGTVGSPHWRMCQRLAVGAEVMAPDGRPSRIHVENTWNTEILPELAPLASDIVIIKRRWSAFYDTELDSQLRRLGARYLIVTGCTTSMCIESTIRDAAFRDYICLLPADCTGQPARHDSGYSGHEASLKIIEMSFGWASNSAKIRDALEGGDRLARYSGL